MSVSSAINLPQFEDEYDGLKMRQLIDELMRLYAEFTRTFDWILSNLESLDFVDTTGVERPFLGLSGDSGLGAEVGHVVVKSFASQQTTSATYVDKTGATIAHASLDDNEDYLVFARCTAFNATSQATSGNGVRLTYNNSLVSGGEKLWEGVIGITNQRGMPYSWCGIISSGVTGDLQIEFKSGNGSDTVDCGFVTLLAIKVSDLTLNTNIFHDTDTALVELDDGNFPPTAYEELGATITIGDGTSDYLVFASVSVGDFLSGGNTTDWRVRESLGNTTKVGGIYGMADTTDENVQAHVFLYKAQAATTLTIEATCTGFPVDAKRSFLAAIRLNAFAEFFTGYDADPDESGWGFPQSRDIATISATATVSSTHWGFISAANDSWLGASPGQPTTLVLDIDGAGDVVVGGDGTWQLITDKTTRRETRFGVSVDQTINSGETIDADCQIDTNSNSTGDAWKEALIVGFTWELSGGEFFDVGHPNFITRYLGDTHRFFGSDGADYFEFDIDGTDLNMTGFQIADINLMGITAINAGTVDVDFDAITATSYGGIPEVDLVNKQDAEIISGVWDFTTNPKIDTAGIDTGIFNEARVAAHTGDITGLTALTVHPTAISGKTLVTAVATDMVLLWDATDSLLKRADISDFLDAVAEVNDLTAAVTWANVPDANITVGSVTQHEAALTILESQISDSSILARVGADETISGAWKFSNYLQLKTATDAELNAIADAINTAAGKIQGAVVYNSTTDNPVYAVGSADGDVWVDGAGSTVNTPV